MQPGTQRADFFYVLCVCVSTLQIYRSTSEEPCLDISHEKAVKDLMDTSLRSGRRAGRQWTYQTCTEFGFCTTRMHTHSHTRTQHHIFSQPSFFLCPDILYLCVCVDQTCEDAMCPFSGMVTLQTHTEICPMLFGISQHSLPGRIAFTNSYYGGDNPHTHRVLFVNGETEAQHMTEPQE